jgi:hypothetical protein
MGKLPAPYPGPDTGTPAGPAPMTWRFVMKFLFDDESFSFETLRIAGFRDVRRV